MIVAMWLILKKEYANIILMPDRVDIEKIRRENVSILSLAECNIPCERFI